jgi:hypothetical protein
MYIERDLKAKFEPLTSSYPLIALVGPRQAGKTTFLKEEMKGKDSVYLSFDDPDVKGLFDEDVKKFETQHLEGHGFAVLDEVQYGKDAGSKLKYLADKGKVLWLTFIPGAPWEGCAFMACRAHNIAPPVSVLPCGVHEGKGAEGDNPSNPKADHLGAHHLWRVS